MKIPPDSKHKRQNLREAHRETDKSTTIIKHINIFLKESPRKIIGKNFEDFFSSTLDNLEPKTKNIQ